MRKIDKDGLLLCDIQGDVFASSFDQLSCSSEIFVRRFMLSNVVEEFDSTAILNDSLSIKDIFDSIENEFGKTSYGKVKYDKEVLYWIGYLYRYMCYIYELSSKYVYKLIKPKELNRLYYPYHTMDCTQAIERILESKNISFDLDKQNERLLKLMRRRKYEKELEIINLNTHPISGLQVQEEIKSYDLREDFIVLEAFYNHHIVGNIQFKKVEEACYQIIVKIDDENYLNKGMGKVIFSKGMNYAKDVLKAKYILAKVSKTDEKSIHILKEMKFEYQSEDDRMVSFIRKY